jgi:hypothetical protein
MFWEYAGHGSGAHLPLVYNSETDYWEISIFLLGYYKNVS